jgi:hypothetical protein
VGDEARDPLGLILAAVAGVATWLVLGPSVGAALVGFLVAALVFGVKVAVGSASQRRAVGGRTPSGSFPSPARGTDGYYWLQRADAAVVALRQLSARPPPGSLGEQVSAIDDEAEQILRAMQDIAGRMTVVDQVAAGVDAEWLERERVRLREQIARTSDAMVRDDLDRAEQAVSQQLESYQRLARSRQALLARLQSTAVGLEGLVTRLAEVITLAPEVGGTDAAGTALRDLTRDLDGMRIGLHEVAALTRGGVATPWPGPDLPAAPDLGEAAEGEDAT